jgi:hypothetical protein
MANLKFTLHVQSSAGVSEHLSARVFSFDSLRAITLAIRAGVFGHFSRSKYFLTPYDEETVLLLTTFPEFCGKRLWVFPRGGHDLNPLLEELGQCDFSSEHYRAYSTSER